MEVNEWLDEVLPPMEVDFENDFDENEDGEEDGPIALTMTMEDGSLLGNYTEEWFASSRKPRRFRPSKVSHKKEVQMFIYCQTYNAQQHNSCHLIHNVIVLALICHNVPS